MYLELLEGDEVEQAIAGLDVGAVVKSAVLKRVDAPGLVGDLMSGLVLQALLNISKDTENSIDDAIVGVVGPLLVNEVNKLVADAWGNLSTDGI